MKIGYLIPVVVLAATTDILLNVHSVEQRHMHCIGGAGIADWIWLLHRTEYQTGTFVRALTLRTAIQ